MTNSPENLTGLYVITDSALFDSQDMDITQAVSEAIHGGARIVQYRNKSGTYATRRSEALKLKALCDQSKTLFLINDDIELAIDIQADGVHLGQTDTPLKSARLQLGDDKIIGITCHANITLAEQAQAGGADYVAFGRFYPSKTKPDAPPANEKILAEAHNRLSIAIVAIGGITIDNGRKLIENGAAMLAVSHAVFAAPDIREAAEQFRRLFDQ